MNTQSNIDALSKNNDNNKDVSLNDSAIHNVAVSSFPIRIRTPSETKVINTLTPETTMFQLQTLINQITGIPFGNQKSKFSIIQIFKFFI
jgi:hypothetical protein